MLRSIKRVNTPPSVSIPNDKGVTSKSRTSFTSPVSTPACIAAPLATTSSGFTPRCGSLPKNFSTVSIIFGILVMPPTRITSSISLVETPASFSAFLHGSRERLTSLSTSCSSFERLIFTFKCLGPVWSAVMKGRLTSVCVVLDSSIFAFSAASLRRCRAILSERKSMPCSALNSSARKSITTWSKSSPPRKVSPFVDFTSNTPSPISRMDTSNVPPPRSNTAIVPVSFLSNP